MKKNNYNNYIILLISIVLSFFSIFNILYKNNSKQNQKLEVFITKKNASNKAFVKDILINDNSYLTNRILKYDDNKKLFIYNKEKLQFTINANDIINIIIKKENVNNIKILIDDKVLNVNENLNNNTFVASRNINKFNILKNQFKKTNLYYILMLGVLFAAIYFLVFKLLEKYLNILFNKHIKLYQIFISSIMMFAIYYLNFYSFIAITGIFSMFIIFGLLFLIIYFNRNKSQFNLENNYILISILLGITMLFIIPPFYVLDEDNHFVKSYDHLFYLEKDTTINNYTNVSKNIYNFRDKYQYNKFKLGQRINVLSNYEDMNKKINYKNRTNSIVYGTYTAKDLAYIPSSFMFFICKKLNTNILIAFLFARFINLALALIICFLAIKTIPKYKTLLFTIMTFTNTYQGIMGINQDWLNTSACFLSISFIFYLIYKKEYIEIKDYFKLGLLSIMLAFSKTIYTPLFLFVLLIDNKKFKKVIFHPVVNKLFIIGFAFSMTLISFKLIDLFPFLYPGADRTVTISNYYTLPYLLKNPIKFLTIYYNTFISRFIEDSIKGYFNGYCWYIIWHNKLLLLLIIVIYSGIIFTTPKENNKKDFKLKLCSFIIYAIMYGLISASMLLGWTVKGANSIDGLQPRYYIPIIFTLYLLVNNNIFKLKFNRKYSFCIIYIIIFLNFISYFNIIYRLY